MALLLWLNTLFNPSGAIVSDPGLAGPLGRLLIKPLYSLPVLSSLLAAITILLCGFLLVQLNTKYFFLKSKSQLPLLFFVIITGGLTNLRLLSPALLSAVCIIIVVYRTFESYKKDRLSFHFLDGGILMGFAVLIYIPALVIFPLLVIILLLFRKRVWQEWIYPWIGICLPFLFWASYLFMTDQPLHSMEDEFRSAFNATDRAQTYSTMQFILYGYLLFLVLIGSIHMIRSIGIRKIQSRVFFLVFFWLFLLSFLMRWVIPASGTDFVYTGGISIAFLLGNYFTSCRNTRFNNLLLALLLAGVILLIADEWFSFVPGRFPL